MCSQVSMLALHNCGYIVLCNALLLKCIYYAHLHTCTAEGIHDAMSRLLICGGQGVLSRHHHGILQPCRS